MMLKKIQLTKAKEHIIEIINKNIRNWVNLFPDASSICGQYPRVNNFLVEGGWTAGFWTGILWDAYSLTKNTHYKKMAEYHLSSFRHRLRENILVDHHDIGFLFIPSAIREYSLFPNQRCKETIILAADVLMKRFKKNGGYIQAWGSMSDKNSSRIIIDCNLNVPLLFKASELTNDIKYKNAALMHLENAVNNLIREDGSTYHTFFFDYDSGKPLYGKTHQGFNDDSCWARGQAWAVYGFALAYKQTMDEKYLFAYKQTTNYFIEHLPENKIPFWDLIFKENSNEERDTSAAAIFLNGIMEMSDLITDKEQKKYEDICSIMFNSIVDTYLTDPKIDEGFIKESVYNKPSGNGVNECTIWGDFFFLQFIARNIDKNWRNIWV